MSNSHGGAFTSASATPAASSSEMRKTTDFPALIIRRPSWVGKAGDRPNATDHNPERRKLFMIQGRKKAPSEKERAGSCDRDSITIVRDRLACAPQ